MPETPAAPTLFLLGRRSNFWASRSASTSAFLRLLTLRVPAMTDLMKRTRLLMRSSSASAACNRQPPKCGTEVGAEMRGNERAVSRDDASAAHNDVRADMHGNEHKRSAEVMPVH